MEYIGLALPEQPGKAPSQEQTRWAGVDACTEGFDVGGEGPGVFSEAAELQLEPRPVEVPHDVDRPQLGPTPGESSEDMQDPHASGSTIERLSAGSARRRAMNATPKATEPAPEPRTVAHAAPSIPETGTSVALATAVTNTATAFRGNWMAKKRMDVMAVPRNPPK